MRPFFTKKSVYGPTMTIRLGIRHFLDSAQSVIAITIAVFALLVLCGPASAQSLFNPDGEQYNPFRRLVDEESRRPPNPVLNGSVTRYVLSADDRSFLFEDRETTARIMFLCGANDRRVGCVLDPSGAAAEIIPLTATRGPRGDVFYKNSQGDTLLRIASYGGATVYWPGEVTGSAAAKSFGDVMALSLDAVDTGAPARRSFAAAQHISAMTGDFIRFDMGTPPAESGGVSVLADAIMRAAAGISEVTDDPTGARIFAEKVRQVRFIAGDAAEMRLVGRTLLISYVPDRDISGRLSSREIERFLEDSL